LDNVDKIIWILPGLGLFDVASTFYMEYLGFHLELYEGGVFAAFFVGSAWIYVYAVAYLLGLCALSYVLWDIKNKRLDQSMLGDKVVYLFLVGAACFAYVRVTMAFTNNLLLPYYISRQIGAELITLLVVSSMFFTLGLYLWRDVLKWVKPDGKEKKR